MARQIDRYSSPELYQALLNKRAEKQKEQLREQAFCQEVRRLDVAEKKEERRRAEEERLQEEYLERIGSKSRVDDNGNCLCGYCSTCSMISDLRCKEAQYRSLISRD